MQSPEAIIGVGGKFVRARTLKRWTLEEAWSVEDLLAVQVIPSKRTVQRRQLNLPELSPPWVCDPVLMIAGSRARRIIKKTCNRMARQGAETQKSEAVKAENGSQVSRRRRRGRAPPQGLNHRRSKE